MLHISFAKVYYSLRYFTYINLLLLYLQKHFILHIIQIKNNFNQYTDLHCDDQP